MMKVDLISRWIDFIKERFSPEKNLLLVLIFYLFNYSGALALSNISRCSICPERIITGYFLVVLIFLRLRLFDEVKDYRQDIVKNPQRPLPRGLVTVKETNILSGIVIIIELIFVFFLGKGVIAAYLVFLAFSILMRFEFFAGVWLREKTELYALMHTYSASLIALFIFKISLNTNEQFLPTPLLIFSFCSWFIFNVFEFARKTFGKGEIPDDKELYSERLGPAGAFLLTLVNLLPAISVIVISLKSAGLNFSCLSVKAMLIFSIMVVITLLPIIYGINYSFRPDRKRAEVYRKAVEIYLAGFQASASVFFILLFWGYR